MTDADDKPKNNKGAWRDKRAEVLRENLKKRKMMQRERSEMENSATDTKAGSEGDKE